jgi:hypothetical protein
MSSRIWPFGKLTNNKSQQVPFEKRTYKADNTYTKKVEEPIRNLFGQTTVITAISAGSVLTVFGLFGKGIKRFFSNIVDFVYETIEKTQGKSI